MGKMRIQRSLTQELAGLLITSYLAWLILQLELNGIKTFLVGFQLFMQSFKVKSFMIQELGKTQAWQIALTLRCVCEII